MSQPIFAACEICGNNEKKLVYLCMGCEKSVCKEHRSADFQDRCLCIECQPKATKA